MSNLITAIQGRDLDATGMSVTVRGTLEGSPPRFQKMVMEVHGEGLDRDQMEKMVQVAERGCIVANTLKQFIFLSLP